MSIARRRGFWIGLTAVVLLAIFLIASLGRSDRKRAQEVRLEKVERGPIEAWVRAPGRVKPERVVQMSSNVQGRVAQLDVKEGQTVQPGDLLLRLDDARYRSAVAQGKADLDAARANHRLAAEQQALSQRQYERSKKLFGRDLATPEALDQARTQARIESAREAAAAEEVRRAEAYLAQAEKDLDETVFRAPIRGRITELNVEVGENVVTGTMNNPGTVVLTLSVLDSMEVEAEVDETDVIRIERGQTAKVLVDAVEDTTLGGVVTSVGQSGRRNVAGSQATHFLVRVRILDPPEFLRPGMSGDVEILTGRRDSALVVPIQALVAPTREVVERWESGGPERPGKDRAAAGTSGGVSPEDEESEPESEPLREERVEGVFLVRDGTARFTPLDLGIRSDTHVEVSGEIRPGDEIVVGPYRVLRQLRDGDLVKAAKS
jgi:HlyD family secretion protein